MVAGIKREKGIKQDQKTPVMMDDIKRMIQQLEKNAKGLRDRALLLIGFVDALRRSEIVALDYIRTYWRKTYVFCFRSFLNQKLYSRR